MPFRVVLDACVLLPYQLCDLLLRLAESGMYEPLWSDEILDEVERNLVSKFEVASDRAANRINHMRRAFPFAMVEGHRDLITAMTNDPKDRHVAAAAVRGHAALIVTSNLKDFPQSSLDPYGIEAVHPDDFLQDQLDLDPNLTLQSLERQRQAYTRPALSFGEFYRTLSVVVPEFAFAASSAESARAVDDAPLPLELVSGEDAAHAFFPDGDPTPESPLGAAYLWWVALLNIETHQIALQNLSASPADWGDYRGAFEILGGWSMMQFVEFCSQAPEIIAYVKFMPDTGHAMRAFAMVPLDKVQVLTLVKCPDGWWRVWGLSENYFPSAQRVLESSED